VKRYAEWIARHRHVVLVLSLLLTVASGYLAKRLKLASDLTVLLPPSQPSVRDLKALQARVVPFATLQIVVEGPTAAETSSASDKILERISHITSDPTMVREVTRDDSPRLSYAWEHRFLFAKLEDLVAARNALRARIDNAKLEANPLFISLDDEPETKTDDRFAKLEKQLDDLEESSKHPPRTASKDGLLQVISIQTQFSASDTSKGRALVHGVQREIKELQRDFPTTTFGLSSNVMMALYEHDSVIDGMAWSLGLTLVLVGAALLLYYRSGKLVLAMLWSLSVGALATFAITWVMFTRLNVMTAFLFAIVVGNGINPALILVSRFLEELRAGKSADAIESAMRGALPGTLGAAATAAIAYTSLIVTDFRGFREFGAIGGIGMALTWLTTFSVLPAMLAVFVRRGWVQGRPEPAVSNALARIAEAGPGRRYRATLVIAGVVTLVAVVVTTIFVAGNPFTHDWRDLQSSTHEIRTGEALNNKIKARLEHPELTGAAYQLIVAVDHRADVAPFVQALRDDNAKRPVFLRWIKDVITIDDLLPDQQDQKLAVLAEIRGIMDSPEFQDALGPADAARIKKLRPPDDLRVVTDADIPYALAWPFIERDGTRGRLLLIRGASRLNSFDVDDRLEFAREARKLALPSHAVMAAESLVVADIIAVMEHDAPPMIAFALLGSILAVMMLMGINRHTAVTIGSGIAGVVLMIAACAIVGLKVHFLDLIALPISIGIGIDYAVNVAARERQEGERGIAHVLRTTGGAVILCSYTTTVGYGTLLLSANGGIRAFGLAASIGEVCCVAMALLVAPAALAWLRAAHRRS
jgi:hypothetical protein